MSFRESRSKAKLRRWRPTLESIEQRLLLSTNSVDLGQFPLRSSGLSNTVLVRFAENADQTSALNALGAYVSRSNPDGPETIVLGEGITSDAAIQLLSQRTDVIYAEPNSEIKGAGDVVPNDTMFPQLWGLSNGNGTSIDAPQAWGISTGGPVIVAVIDSGLDLTNQDLASQVWVNAGEVSGNRRDDDRDGYVDDVNGWNFVNNTKNVQDDNGHGSHISGVIAAAGNNNYGVVGVNWKAKIMPLKFLDSTGNGSTDDAITAIYYAVAHGARVINASWGGQGFSKALHDAINYAAAHNVVFVTAAGNESVNNDTNPSYPANDRLSNTLSVAAIDRSGNLASFSNWGPTTVDIAAPGVGITSTIPGGFATYSGTSMATPYVSGVASLIVALHPEFTAIQIVTAIKSSAKPDPSLTGLISTGGILSAARAITIGIPTAQGNPPVSTSSTLSADKILDYIVTSTEFTQRTGGTGASYVTAIYRQILGRDPEPAALTNWSLAIASGASLDALVSGVQASPEAARTKVARWYQTYLGRTQTLDALKNSSEVIGWANLLKSGGTDESVQASLMASAEYWTRNGSSVNGLVSALYRDVLGRTPDSSGLVHWRSAFNASSSRYDVIRQFQGGDESKRVEIARMYISALGRSGTAQQLLGDDGVMYWADRLAI